MQQPYNTCIAFGRTKSQPYLQAALRELSSVLPSSRLTELRGLGHTAANNGGKPEVVAQELRNFFGPDLST